MTVPAVLGNSLAMGQCDHLPSPREGVELNAAQRAGVRFLAFRDRACATPGERCRQHLCMLPEDRDRVTVGRTAIADIALEFDPDVSRAHCTLERVGSEWVLTDHGLSRHGSFVNDRQVRGAQTLRHGDRLRVGGTTLVYYAPADSGASTRWPQKGDPPRWAVTDAERRVLIELCRPFGDRSPYATAPSNHELAAALDLRVETIKTHLRHLFEKFEIEELPQHRKRVRLAQRALETGAISPYELYGR
jgi:hypothetical protein